jgi:hypothetical protein
MERRQRGSREMWKAGVGSWELGLGVRSRVGVRVGVRVRVRIEDNPSRYIV